MTKASSGLQFLTSETEDFVGFRRPSDGKEYLVPTVETDPLTGGIALSGGGKAFLSRNSLTAIRAIALGDSITQGDNDNAANVSGNSWFELMCISSMGRLRRVANAGVAGNTTAQMLARIQADVIAKSPSICFIHAGTNDAGNSVPIATTMANIDAICAALLTAAIEPVLCLTPPRNTFQAGAELINIRLVDFALRNGLRVIAPWRTLSSSSGGWANGTTYSADGIHPTSAANKIAAVDALSQLTLANVMPWLPRNNTDSNGLLTNCLSVTDTNADGLPDGWIKYGQTVTASLVAGTGEVIGNWLQIAFAGITGAGVVERSLGLAGYAAGNKLALVGRFKTSGFESGTAKAAISLTWQGPNSKMQPVTNFALDLADGVFYIDGTVPSGVTGILIQIIPNANPTTGTGTISVAQMQLYNLTTLGID